MISNIILLALPLVATYLLTAIWHRRFRQFAHFPQPKPSLLWGHLQAMHAAMKRNAPGLHVDPIFADMSRELGNPPLMLLDFRPVGYPMAIVTSHEVAEQVSRASKLFPWSTPKSPTFRALVRLIGDTSIFMREVCVWPRICY